MKKILYIEANRDGTVGGSYYSLLCLVQGLDKTKYEPHIWFCQDNFLVPEFKKITPYVYINNFGPSASSPLSKIDDFIKWPYRFLVKIILKQFKLRKIINKLKPDLIHLNNGYAAMHEWMLAAYLHKVKIIAHDRGTQYPCSFQTKVFAKFLDAIVSVSDSYKENIVRQKLGVKRIYRVYNAIDINKFFKQITLEDSNILKKEFNLKENQPVVGIIGNIMRWKGQHIVLQAIRKVKKLYPTIKCLIIGKVALRSESYKQELDKYIIDNDLKKNIVFTGFREDVPGILSLLDIMVHASIEPEPFGRVILEGMAMSKPIIATNVGGPAEIIVEGETGILIPMGDHDKISDAILYYLSDVKRAKEMGEKGRQRLIKIFNIERMVAGIEKIYEDIFTN